MAWLVIPVLIAIVSCCIYIGYDIYGKHKVIQIALDNNYIEIRDACLQSLFVNPQFQQTLRVSDSIVNNFAYGNQIKYLIKYFGMRVNNDAIEDLLLLEEATKVLVNDFENKKVPKHFWNYVLPVFSMKYVSPGGKTTRESCFVFGYSGVQYIRKNVESMMEKDNFAKRQRSKMTPALREYIKKRDHYTCQLCGDSIYKHPNLVLEVDHIIPVSKGGETTVDNLWTLCMPCNRKKSNNIL